MKKYIIIAATFILFTLNVNADTINNIKMNIYLNEDGSANITELWDVKADSGTEWYKQLLSLGNSEISNYNVLMDGKTMTYKTWNVNESLSQKSGYYGINYISNGLELCFGKGDMKNHTFTVNYTLSNYVFNTDDNQVLYWTLMPNVSLKNFQVEVSSYYSFPDTLDVWGYGYKGYAYVENGVIKMSNEGSLSNDYVTLLARFPVGTFKTTNTNSMYTNFDEVQKTAQDGSYQYNYDEESSNGIFWTIVSIITNLFPFIIIAWIGIYFSKPKYGYVGNKKIDKNNTNMFRDIPCNKDIYYANTLIYLNNFSYKETNILGAIILKWIKENKVTIINQTKGIFNKETSSIDLTKENTFDIEIEEKLYNIMRKAAGKDLILETKELEKWCSKHYNEFFNLFEKINNNKVNELKNTNLIRKRINKTECKALNVLDEQIYKDSSELLGLKLYLEEFSDMKDKSAIEVKLWDEYLMFAYLFGIAKKVANQFKNLYPEIITEMEKYNMDFDTLYYINNLSVKSVSAASSARSAAQNYSSGGGGFSSGGGGGGSFGGGGSMGGR